MRSNKRYKPLVVLGLTIGLCGCGGGGGSSVTAPASSVVQGTVSSDYSSSPLNVASSWATANSPVQSGQFNVAVSAQAAQTLFAIDQGNLPHALATSIPGSTPTFSVTQTAATLLFMSPGIYTRVPSNAASRIQQIEALSTFPALVSALSGQTAADLVTALANPATKTAFQNCIAEWFSKNAPAIIHPQAIISDSSGIVDLVPFGVLPSPISSTDVNVQNTGFRVLEVYEKLFPTDGSTPTVQRLTDLSGATGVSLVGALFQQVGEPSNQDYKVDFSSAGSYRAEFYFRGLGAQTNNVQVPSDSLRTVPNS